jgi:hypothetical protein
MRGGAGRKPGMPSFRTTERMKYLGPVGERAIAVLVDAMQNPAAPWSSRVWASQRAWLAALLAALQLGAETIILVMAVTRVRTE